MKPQVIKNLTSVRDEALDIMGNLEKVRGTRYKTVVSMLLSADRMVEIVSMLEMASKDRDAVVKPLRECFFMSVHDQLSESFKLAGIEEQELQDAMQDAERIRDSIHDLQNKAVVTGLAGEKFGDQ